MKLAFLTTRLFERPRSGGEICTQRLLDALCDAGHEAVCVGRGESLARQDHVAIGATARAFDELPVAQRLAEVGLAMVRGQPCTVARLCAGGAARRARRALQALVAEGCSAVVVDHLQAFAWLGDTLPGLPLLLVMHNIESDGYLRRSRRIAIDGPGAMLRRHVLRREWQGLRELERSALARAAAVACLSEGDAQRLRELMPAGAQPLIEVLTGFPAAAPQPPAVPAAGLRRIGLLGTWTWGPNRDALDWMLAEVLPRLPADCRLVLAGSGLENRRLPARVSSLGRIGDVASFYAQVDVVAVPSLHGSGVQEKAIEAIGTGRPVVATPHALRGLGAALPPQVQAAADAAAFALACAEAPLAAQAEGRLELLAWTAQRRSAHDEAVARCVAKLTMAGTSVGAARQQRQHAQHAQQA